MSPRRPQTCFESAEQESVIPRIPEQSLCSPSVTFNLSLHQSMSSREGGVGQGTGLGWGSPPHESTQTLKELVEPEDLTGLAQGFWCGVFMFLSRNLYCRNSQMSQKQSCFLMIQCLTLVSGTCSGDHLL